MPPHSPAGLFRGECEVENSQVGDTKAHTEVGGLREKLTKQ